ncbi:holin [Streptomyces sp. VNUA116]|uniref:holin n=1 Tax=Streptomyces sp. VNUA116 TaxID=3062449 RepID=UPI00267599BB|nr:holin [Streptomyces sp. VNUA116]WKU43864.1 holin [Streptomyces sp. VNUA116]
MQKAQQKVLLDILERTAAAYVTTFLGLLLADGFDLTDVSALKAAAVAALPAALSVIKGAIGTRFGDRGSAAWLPGGSRGRKPSKSRNPRKAAAKDPKATEAAESGKATRATKTETEATKAETEATKAETEVTRATQATDGSTGTTGG